MGQPDTVNQLPDFTQLLNLEFDVENLLTEPYITLSLGHNAYKWG